MAATDGNPLPPFVFGLGLAIRIFEQVEARKENNAKAQTCKEWS
jgi:hypothetical protein